jgi:predicted CopG family antitoxin
MAKTLKIDKKTHYRLSRQGSVGDTFDDVVNRLIDVANRENILLLYRFTNKEPPRELYLANPMYFWTEENYKAFFEMISHTFPDWINDVIKYISKNDDLYNLVLKHRDERKTDV